MPERLRLLAALAAFCGPALVGCGSSADPPPPDDPPSAVFGLSARPGAFADTLTWLPSGEPDFQAYRVARSPRGVLGDGPPDTALVEIGTTFARGDTVWIDTDVSPDHSYLYSVVVVDAGGQESAPRALPIRTDRPAGLALGLEPRRALRAPGDSLAFTLWASGAADLFGAVLRLEHAAVRTGCTFRAPFGDPTLGLCLGPSEGPTELAISGVRGGPTLEGSAVLAELVFAPGSDLPDSLILRAVSLLRPDGTPVEGADLAILRGASWGTPR